MAAARGLERAIMAEFELSEQICSRKADGVMENDLIVEINALVDAVIMSVIKLSESKINAKKSQINKYRHIDIDLGKNEKCYWIQVTHCGWYNDLNPTNVVDILIVEFLKRNKGEFTAIFFKSSDNDYELVYDFTQLIANKLIRPAVSDNIQFPHLKEYLSVKMEYKLSKKTTGKFKEILIQQLIPLLNEYPHIKYTFHSGDEMIYTNRVQLDEIHANCQLMSSAIEKMLRNSLNPEFRERCLQLLNIEYPGMATDAVMTSLFTLFHDNYQI